MISNLRRICHQLVHEPDIEKAIQSIGLHGCFSGNFSRLFMGRFVNDAELTRFATFGFEPLLRQLENYEKFFLPKLISKPLQSGEVFIANHDVDYQNLFTELVGGMDDALWKSTLVLLANDKFLVTMSTQIQIEDNQQNQEYFQTLSLITDIYLNTRITYPRIMKRESRTTNGQQSDVRLTERQSLILQLIKLGNTNNSIANRMGYSESLIRQESIAIYRKLGVGGRKDLPIKGEADEEDAHLEY